MWFPLISFPMQLTVASRDLRKGRRRGEKILTLNVAHLPISAVFADPRACPQEAKYQKHLHLDTIFCHCSTWRSYKCPVCASSTGTVIDALFNHHSDMGETRNSTIKVCRRIFSQECFKNWDQIQQLAVIIKYFLAAKVYWEGKKARPQCRWNHMART